ncbi:MAG: CBS domain-containing protein [Dokdonella sp.]
MIQVKHLLQEKGDQVYSIAPEQSVIDAIRMMADYTIGALLVISNGNLVGVVTERDYARKVALMGRSSSETKVADIVPATFVSVVPDDSVDRCMRLCTKERVRHLPVLDNGRIVGVLSIGDLVKAVIDQQAEQLEHLQRYING